MKRYLLSLLLVVTLSTQVFAQVDFRKETIYFLITSRFFDGDSTNNAPTEWCSYIPGVSNPNMTDPKDVSWRGDFKGLIQKLDYIKGMGFTAIWITPVVQNRSPLDYHGYHAWDFTKVDPRLESPGATFQDLINAVHAKGMKLVLDIVTNHSGRYGIKGVAELKYNNDPTKVWGKNLAGNTLLPNPNWDYDGITPNPDDGRIWSRANLAKMPAPYNQNLAAWNWPCTESFINTSDSAYFHHSGNGFVQGWDDTTNCYQRAVSDDCPDLNTGSKAVQDYMYNAYATFINMGVDAFRWDTWKHMNKGDIFALSDRFKALNPNLFIFGEVAQKRFDLHSVEELNPHWYTWRGATNASTPSGLGVLDFYGEATFHNTFENGGAFSGVTDAARYDNLYSDPSLLVTWLDNHDFGPNNDWNMRYSGSPENLASCMNFMFTWRGIPCVYYGTEEQFQRGIFCDIHDASGVQKSLDLTGRAYYGNEFANAQNTKLYKHFKKLNAIRRAIPALQGGSWNWGGNYPGNGIGYTRTLNSQVVAVGLAKDGNASFNFTVPNGTYKDAVTGRVATVTNGSLAFTVQSNSAGIYVLNGPGMIGGSGLGYFEPCVTGCSVVPPDLTISPVSNNYYNPITVSMSTTGGTGASSIYYTTDGSTPTTSSTKYTAAFSVSTATVVKAIAVDANGNVSAMEGQSYTFVLPKPTTTISPAAGNYYNSFACTISCGGNGTKPPYKIYYTTDGSTPTTSSTLYNGSQIGITVATTVKAISVDSNNQVSPVASNTYTFNIPPPVVTANPTSGNFPAGNVNVSLVASSPRPPAQIFYTTDGSIPTTSSTVYTTQVQLGPNATTLKYIGEDAQGRISTVDSQRFTFSQIPDMWVYFKRPATWATPIKIYYWSVVPAGAATTVSWPGINATQVCPGGDWWVYKFSGVSSVNVIFNDGNGKQTANLTNITTTTYFDLNTPLTYIPDVNAPIGRLTATPVTGSAPLTVNFDATASSGCTVLGYFWNFGDSTYLQSGLNGKATETYRKPGTYYMNVIVQDQNNNRDTVRQTIVVTANAVNSMTLHLKPATSWTSKPPYLYYWASVPATATDAWPGVAMTSETNGWYKYTITGDTCTSLIFNNNSSPQTVNLTHCGDGWYDGTIPAWVSNPLPVKLINFSGELTDKKVRLNWTVAEETNMKGYTIESSTNAELFTPIGFVAANDQSGNKMYGYTDHPDRNGVWYYRLKIMNNNGSFSYSNVIALKVTGIGSVVVYPNPVKDLLYIQNSLLIEGKYTARISDMVGKEIIRKDVFLGNNQTASLNINKHIPTGSYLLQLIDLEGKTVQSQIVQISQ